MAIIIPSKNTYDRQNPKVRDNVIERIEVGAVEVVPNNEYETPVYNKSYSNAFSEGQIQEDYQRDVDAYSYISYEAFVEAIPYYLTIDKIEIPILKNNEYIDKLYIGEDENKNAQIKCSLIGTIKKGQAEKSFNYKTAQGLKKYETIYNQPNEIQKNQRFEIPNKIIKETISVSMGLYEATAKVEINDLSNIISITYKEQNGAYIFENLKILSGIKFAKIKGSVSFVNPDDWGDYTLQGIYEEYTPTEIEITIYGNTIGIDLTDKTVYINGKTAKKVHSIDGNELMQTSNYIMGENGTKTNALDKMYGDTQIDYARGKETATIRCSISDYYDGDQKIIAIDNSTGKMSFDIGDRVIPMVYGADGKDRPMSTYQDGSPKEFEVIGTKKFYDGAVWQELSLQEC